MRSIQRSTFKYVSYIHGALKNAPTDLHFLFIFIVKANRATIHLDTKALQDLTGPNQVERYAVALYQESGVQLLGIPKIENATGEVMAEEVYSTQIDRNTADRIVAISSDTISSNSGQHNGAVQLLERKLRRSLL